MNLANASNITIGSTSVSAVYLGNNKIWPSTPSHDYSQDYLTIVSLANNNDIIWRNVDTMNVRPMSYSTDLSSWITISPTTVSNTVIATLNIGDRLYLKGSNNGYHGQCMIRSTDNFNVSGNIMSLLYGDNFVNQTSLLNNRALSSLFEGASYLIDASNLILPATLLTNLCYESMFYDCTSLTTAPELPATTLASECYMTMFYGCTSLTTAPELPATTLVYGCYHSMLYNCSNLNYIKCLATDISATDCTQYWTDNVAATGTFVRNPNMTSWTTGDNGIPSGWTVQNA